uniref:Uncharacterized protein n=1 Tax=Graphocephala atropunctata TaxID=36148 RepID=A0A1B6KEL4_9HEMI
MFQYSLLLVVVLTLGTYGQRNARSGNGKNGVSNQQANEKIGQLNNEINQLSQETDRLNAEKIKLTQDIENFKESCKNEMSQLYQTHEAMMIKAEENRKILVDLLKKIQDEEAEHIRLEAELKRLSEALELFEHQHVIIYGDLKLMERRRSNGTTDRCNEVTNAIAVELAENMATRSHITSRFVPRTPKLTPLQRQITMLDNKLRITRIMKNKVEGIVNASQSEYQNEVQNCNDKKTNINMLIEETRKALETSEHSIKVLDDDLQASIAFSEAVRVEIKTGKAFLMELREKIKSMKKAMENFSEDTLCFNKIKSMD